MLSVTRIPIRPLALLSALLICLTLGANYLQTVTDENSAKIEFPIRCPINDSECRLAIGKCILLSRSDEYDLELINGISTGLSSKILSLRAKILNAARHKSIAKRYSALQLVKGIGEHRARKFSTKLCVE